MNRSAEAPPCDDLPTANFRYRGVEGGKYLRDPDGRMSGELLRLPKGNGFIFQGHSLRELEKDFKAAVDTWLDESPARSTRPSQGQSMPAQGVGKGRPEKGRAVGTFSDLLGAVTLPLI